MNLSAYKPDREIFAKKLHTLHLRTQIPHCDEFQEPQASTVSPEGSLRRKVRTTNENGIKLWSPLCPNALSASRFQKYFFRP